MLPPDYDLVLYYCNHVEAWVNKGGRKLMLHLICTADKRCGCNPDFYDGMKICRILDAVMEPSEKNAWVKGKD